MLEQKSTCIQVQLLKPGGLSNLKLLKVNLPDIKPDYVLIKVMASSLNYHDLLVAIGMIEVESNRVPLSDAAGKIVKVGSNVKHWKVGDRALSLCFPNWQSGPPKYEVLSFAGDHHDGYASEYVAVQETALTRMPNYMDFAQAATLPCAGLTAWRALVDEGNLKAGETVLVQGTGGVSIFALQLAKSMGAKVIATSSSEEKLNKLKKLGADEVINYKETPEWGKEVLAKTNNEGVDHVIEVGGGGTFGESVRATKLGGHIALIGVLSGPNASEIVLPRIFLKQIRMSGISMANKESQIAMIDYLETNQIEPIISDSFPLSKLADAFQHQIDNKHFGKISITMQ
jgi:NADPH:quinone reductase-like Zn-dependent oxidoreductase